MKSTVRSKASDVFRSGGNPQHYLSAEELRIYKILPYICFKHVSRAGNCEKQPNYETGDDHGVVNNGADANHTVEESERELTDTSPDILETVTVANSGTTPDEMEDINGVDSLIIEPDNEETEKRDNSKPQKNAPRPVMQSKKRLVPVVPTTKSGKKNIDHERSKSQEIGIDKNFTQVSRKLCDEKLSFYFIRLINREGIQKNHRGTEGEVDATGTKQFFENRWSFLRSKWGCDKKGFVGKICSGIEHLRATEIS